MKKIRAERNTGGYTQTDCKNRFFPNRPDVCPYSRISWRNSCFPIWPNIRKWYWYFFNRAQIFQSSGVPIWLLSEIKWFFTIIRNITDILSTTFGRFVMTCYYARSNVITFFQNKILTSNGCKPIRVLTNTKRYLIRVYLYPRLQHTQFWATLKQL